MRPISSRFVLQHVIDNLNNLIYNKTADLMFVCRHGFVEEFASLFVNVERRCNYCSLWTKCRGRSSNLLSVFYPNASSQRVEGYVSCNNADVQEWVTRSLHLSAEFVLASTRRRILKRFVNTNKHCQTHVMGSVPFKELFDWLFTSLKGDDSNTKSVRNVVSELNKCNCEFWIH